MNTISTYLLQFHFQIHPWLPIVNGVKQEDEKVEMIKKKKENNVGDETEDNEEEVMVDEATRGEDINTTDDKGEKIKAMMVKNSEKDEVQVENRNPEVFKEKNEEEVKVDEDARKNDKSETKIKYDNSEETTNLQTSFNLKGGLKPCLGLDPV